MKQFKLHHTSKILQPDKIEIGEGVESYFENSPCCYYQAGNGIKIGDRTLIGPGVMIISANHPFEKEDRNIKWVECKPIQIGADCWLGAGCIILPGVTLADNTIVGAGSVVTKSFLGGKCVIAGNPAKIIRELECI